MARSKILVVDDDTAMREMMKLALTKEGFEVHPAASTDEGRRLVEQGIGHRRPHPSRSFFA